MVLKDYIQDMVPGEGRFLQGNKSWDFSTLLKASKDLEVFDMQLMALSMNKMPWEFKDWDFSSYLFHCNRMNNADLSYPILLTPEGTICDGWHRLAKAILNGSKTIKARRFLVMPEEDLIENN